MRRCALILLLLACGRPEAPPETTTTTTAPTRPAPAPPPTPAPPRVEGPKLPFVDEGAQEPSFATYREQLLAAVRARDAQRVLALSDPAIRTSFGDAGGREDLARKLADPEMWSQLESILTLGGTFRDGMFWAPYVYSTLPDSHDAFATVAVIGDDVPLRERASNDARVLATLSRDLLTADVGERRQWIEVKTADGRSGWVEGKSVRSPIDYRAGFTKSGDAWRMTALVAGD